MASLDVQVVHEDILAEVAWGVEAYVAVLVQEMVHSYYVAAHEQVAEDVDSFHCSAWQHPGQMVAALDQELEKAPLVQTAALGRREECHLGYCSVADVLAEPELVGEEWPLVVAPRALESPSLVADTPLPLD